MRGAFILLSIFTISFSGLLFWQWETYNNEKAITEKGTLQEASQKIIVEANSKELKVTQIFNKLNPDKEYRVLVPEMIKKWTCMDDNNSPCKSNDKIPETFMADQDRIQLHYTLPLKNRSSYIYLRNWTAKLHQIDIKHTSLQIIDTGRRKGAWVAGLPYKATKNMEYIDYYVFEGSGSEEVLYWQAEPLYRHKWTKDMTIYTASPNPPLPKVSRINELIDKGEFMAIIQTSKTFPSPPEGLAFVKDVPNENLLTRMVASNHIRALLDGEVEQPFFIDLLSSLILGEQAESAKGKFMLAEMSSQLDQEQKNIFLSKFSKGENWNAAKLDKVLGDIKGLKTNFFKENLDQQEKDKSLSFFDNRKVLLNGKDSPDLQVIHENDQLLFPLKETMSRMGFKVRELPEIKAIELDNGVNKYRFYLNRKIFHHNQTQYGLLEVPLWTRNGTIYIEQKGLQALFKFDVKENDREISLSL